jgi:hypothetical protein
MASAHKKDDGCKVVVFLAKYIMEVSKTTLVAAMAFIQLAIASIKIN